jgi:hypothetical protein
MSTDDVLASTDMLRAAISYAIEELYNIGAIPRLFINTEYPGVVVPPHLKKRFGTRLPIDLRPEYPMFLEHTTEALEATLAFSGAQVRCVFPWASIYIIADANTGAGKMIEQNVPVEGAAEVELLVPSPQTEPVQARAEKLGLRMVKGGKA